MVSALKARIDRLYRHSLEHRAEVGRFGEVVNRFNRQLETRVPREELDGVLEWHELIGSTPPPNMPTVSESIRTEAVNSIERLICETESQWGLAA